MKRLILAFIAGLLLVWYPLQAQRVLYIGDSVTDGGWGRSGGNMTPSNQRNLKDLNHIYGHSYMMLCAAHYESTQPYAGLRFFNRGISGNTLDDLKERWQQDVLNLKPDENRPALLPLLLLDIFYPAPSLSLNSLMLSKLSRKMASSMGERRNLARILLAFIIWSNASS